MKYCECFQSNNVTVSNSRDACSLADARLASHVLKRIAAL